MKRIKVTETKELGAMEREQVLERLNSYNHSDVLNSVESAELMFETKTKDEFILFFIPKLLEILNRHLNLKLYS